MRSVEIKYGFPIFSRDKSTAYLVKNGNVYVSDIWSFWNYIIKVQGKKDNVKQNQRTNFLRTLLEQAHYFYISAEQAPFKAKPLLYYYAFMNIAKVVINIDSYIGTTKDYYHGIECHWEDVEKLSDAEIQLKNFNGSPTKLSVSYQFMKIVGTINAGQQWPWTCNVLSELFSSCVGIHRAYAEVGNQKESFFRLDNIELNKEGKRLIFTAEIHDCSNKNVLMLRKRYGNNITEIKDEKGILTGKYGWAEEITMKSNTSTRADYYRLSELIKNKGIWYLWNNKETISYVSPNAILQPPESIIYNIMFFLGSIARYQPYKFEELLSDREHWMIGEFLQTQPKQFLYLVTSKIIGTGILTLEL